VVEKGRRDLLEKTPDRDCAGEEIGDRAKVKGLGPALEILMPVGGRGGSEDRR